MDSCSLHSGQSGPVCLQLSGDEIGEVYKAGNVHILLSMQTMIFSMIMQKGNLNPILAESEQKLYRRNHIKSKTTF